MPKNKPKISLSNEKVKDITFFEEDLNEMTNQLTSAEDLYKNLYSVYTNLTGGKYINIKSPRDIAEIAKALVQMRSLCSDTAFKRHQIRKNLSDIVHKEEPSGEFAEEDFIKNTARTILNEVRGYMGGSREMYNMRQLDNQKFISDDVKTELDLKVNQYIENGDIKLSENDKLIGLSSHIEFKYDKLREGFVALDSRNGSVIDNFPKERLPQSSITRIINSEVITNTGDTYKILEE
jgi:hypothetical protein